MRDGKSALHLACRMGHLNAEDFIKPSEEDWELGEPKPSPDTLFMGGMIKPPTHILG